MKPYVIDMLECPECHAQLDWRIEVEADNQIEAAEARCSGCEAVYHVRDGIGIFLTPDLPRKDMWAQVESHLAIHLRENPDLEKQLLQGPVEQLSPTDQHFRAMILDERGRFGEAREIEERANQNMYTPGYLACWQSQMDHVLESLASLDGPIVDLASGRCYLVEEIIRRLQRQVIATDFSLAVLRRDRSYFKLLGLDEFVSFLAFDARKTPFKDGAITTMTTNLGLPNIEDPGSLMIELKRIVGGTLLAITHFFPEDDEPNRQVIEDAGLDAFNYQDSALRYFGESGWIPIIENACTSPALPTPESTIFEGARADGLPVAPTELKWCTIRATSRA
ncbi:MAG: methyltransferase domain-containing protein [Anaerolineales bacterium]|jgi:uncharacterized protein YbaR (Trm112 family)